MLKLHFNNINLYILFKAESIEIEQNAAKVMGLLDDRDREIRRLKDIHKKERPDELMQEIMDAQSKAEEESLKNRAEAAEQKAQVQEERRKSESLQREVERLQSGNVDGAYE